MDANAPVDKGDILSIDPALLDPRFEYFYADSGKPGNMQKKEAKDWDIVYDTPSVEVGDAAAGKPKQDGSMVTLPGLGSNGGDLVLMSKKKEWCDQDRAKMEQHLKITEDQIKQKNEEKFDVIKE